MENTEAEEVKTADEEEIKPSKDLLTKLLANSANKNLGTAIELLKLYDFDFRLLYQGAANQGSKSLAGI